MPPHPDPAAVNFTATSHSDTYDFISKANHKSHTVFVSGASKGIGRETALAFARAGAAAIIVAARSELTSLESEIRSISPSTRVVKVKLDVSAPEEVEAAAAHVKSHVSSIDILFNNAGYLASFLPFTESDPDEWIKTWDVNVKGLYLVTRAFLPLVLASELKTVINVSSIGAHLTRRGASAYQTSKLAVLRLSEFMNSDYGEQGLLAYAIHPGAVATELGMNLPSEWHSILVDKPQLCADTVAWLTDEKRDWLAGRYISVNWDMQQLLAKKEDIVERDTLKMRLVI
ncbi:hypothetical protein V2A60_004895 [Cordyceps javanica]|uniref:NAD-P-binding protein n=1 Tax=Cordyceps javanica TaxID=43265 RepID=A0A545WA83_9HYPO|nr:NAD-P-binding protein [Cordyceps javanica]TQW10903.1 NAD-P-binding protein [Cordyceps javanica]